MGFDERSRVLSGKLHCPQGANNSILADTFLEIGNVFVESTQQRLILAAKSLIRVAHYLCSHKSLTV